MTTIVAISGLAGSGKSTAARVLVDHLGFAACDLATPMKVACKAFFGFSDAQLWGPSENRNEDDPRWGFSPRVALQRLGTEYGRALHPDVWIRACLRDCAKWPRAVIADARFSNEIEAARDAGGLLVRLKRGMVDGADLSTLHSSEAEQLSIPDEFFDVVIDNRKMSVRTMLRELTVAVSAFVALRVDEERPKVNLALVREMLGRSLPTSPTDEAIVDAIVASKTGAAKTRKM